MFAVAIYFFPKKAFKKIIRHRGHIEHREIQELGNLSHCFCLAFPL
jgi:hypothetical protein